MNILIFGTPDELAAAAAKRGADLLRKTVEEKGRARLMLSTGASQFGTLRELVSHPVDWSKVEMFHLDEYVGLPESHGASFRRYLRERFVSKVNPGKVHFVNWEGGAEKNMKALSEEISKAPVDVAFIGIGENGHIAFNDPPADFATEEPFLLVTLDSACRRQQVGEGWFPTADDVPEQAITASVRQILKCRTILASVPFRVKAEAVRKTLESPVDPAVPASILKTHPDVTLYLDRESASLAGEYLPDRFR
ncbi:MAG: glucosamine-6-phosphate deaminase [Aminivibrio sp.]|nr:glucosamine-6-phosphate deaminase [Aminivibrio sp.]